MNTSELETILGQAVRIVAARLGISNVEFFSVDELRTQVKAMDASVSYRLESFINSYWEWFDFHRRIEAQGKQGNLDFDENATLVGLVGKRNETREELLQCLPTQQN